MQPPQPTSTGIARFIPGLALIKGFSPALLSTEFVVAITVVAVLVPSAMAFGDLAGVTPVAGLYVALGAMVMYAFFGTSKQVIMGPEATAAIMTATAVAPLAGGDAARYAALAALLALLVGVVALLARVAKLGFITDLLSKPVLVGYILGAALIVIGSQLGKMFGIKLESDKFFQQVTELISRLDEAHLLTVAIGVVCMAALLIIRRVNRKLPGPLIVVVVAIIASYVLGWAAKGVAVVGAVPPGLPKITVPAVTVSDIFALLPAALALTILIYADEILTSRVFAAKHAQKVDANQEFVALGMANIGAGFLMGFPAALSASRTTVNDQMGGKTQWVGLIAAALTIIFLLFLTPLLAPLPTAALGAIIIVASLGLIDIAAFRFLRQVRPAEFWLAVITAFGVLTVGVLAGILVAVVLSLIILLYRIRAAARCAAGRRRCGRWHGVPRRRRQRDGDDRAGPDRLPFRRAARVCERGVLHRTVGGADRQRRRGVEMRYSGCGTHQRFRLDGGRGVGKPGCGAGTGRRRPVDRARERAAASALDRDWADDPAWRRAHLSVGACRGGGVSRAFWHVIESPVKRFRGNERNLLTGPTKGQETER